MSLTKQVNVDKIEVTENGSVQVRQVTRIIENGNELSKSFHRWVLLPGQDVSDQPDNVKAICEVTWTPEVIAAFIELESNSSKTLG